MENENYIYIYVKNGITFNLAFVAPFYTSKKKKVANLEASGSRGGRPIGIRVLIRTLLWRIIAKV